MHVHPLFTEISEIYNRINGRVTNCQRNYTNTIIYLNSDTYVSEFKMFSETYCSAVEIMSHKKTRGHVVGAAT